MTGRLRVRSPAGSYVPKTLKKMLKTTLSSKEKLVCFSLFAFRLSEVSLFFAFRLSEASLLFAFRFSSFRS